MLDFLNLKNANNCSLCGGSIRGDNCTPKSCSHVFHTICLEDWAADVDSSDGFRCPAEGCSAQFNEVVSRKTPGSLVFKVVSLKENEPCPICCEPIQKPVATPESCNHAFCYACLREWSRVRHECPLDRGSFELILLSDRIGGPITKRVNALPLKQQPPETPPLELDTNCEICSSPDDEAHLLLCDHCDRGFHTYCLPRPLSSVPEGDWFCPDCVRHGITRTASSTNGTRPARRSRRLLRDSEAEESDHLEFGSSSNDSSRESLRHSRELSSSAQRRLEQRATRRHHGTRLLEDFIARLSERVNSEISMRARRRQNQRQRVRTQLMSESMTVDNQQLGLTQTVLTFTRDQPVAITLNRRQTPDDSIRTRNSHQVRTRSSQRNLTNTREPSTNNLKRLRIASNDSESDSEPNAVVALQPSSSRNSRTSRLVRPHSDSDEDFFPDRVISPVRPRDGHSPRPRRRRLVCETELEQDSPSQNNVDNVVQESSSHLSSEPEASAADDSTFVLPSTSSSRNRVTRRFKRRKCKKPKTSNANKKALKRHKMRLSTTQRKIIKQTKTRQSDSGSSFSSSSLSRKSSHTNLSRVGLPKLSLLGSEPTCSLYACNENANQSPPEVRPTTSTHDPMSSSAPKTTKSTTYLSDIEAAQASMFHFTTRHMQINPDYSMSPIPVSKSSTNQALIKSPTTSQCSSSISTTTTTSNTNDLPSNSSKIDTKTVTSPNPGTTTSNIPTPSTSNSIPPTSGSVVQNGNADDPTSSEVANSWTPDKLERVQCTLKHHLKVHLVMGRIDKDMYKNIFKRCLVKVTRKPASKVTEDRIRKLIDDYVDYLKRHSSTET